MTVQEEPYRPELDGLRALAVLAVIANHFSKDVLPSGYLGVDIFFVLSGYVITASLHRRPAKTIADFLVGFYVRRVKRLFPALALYVVVAAIAISLFNPAPALTLRTGIASLFGLSNIFLYQQATDYFGDSALFNVFTPTWSLGVEEQFYLLFPMALWFFGAKRLVYPLAGVGLASLIGFVVLSEAAPEAVYFLLPFRVWELAAGSLLFLLGVSSSGFRIGRLSSFALVTLVAVLFAPLSYSTAATVAAVAFSVLLIASLQGKSPAYRLFAHPATVYIGRISYSLYLWHWGVLCLSRWTTGIHPWTVPLQFGLMLALAAASYKFVERPLRTAEWSSKRWGAIGYGLASALAAGVFLYVLATPLNGRLFTGTKPVLQASGTVSLADAYATPDGVNVWAGKDCVLMSNAEVGKVLPIDKCTLGNFSTARRRILVLGNSYSAAFVAAFDRLVMGDKYAVTVTSSWGASPVPGMATHGPFNKANEYYWLKVVPDLVSGLRAGDWVLLISDVAELSPARPNKNSSDKLAELENGLIRLTDMLGEAGIRLAVIHGNPFARAANCDPVAAMQWMAANRGPCLFLAKEETLARRAKLDEVLSRLRDQGRVTVIDLMPVFCPDETCTYTGSNGQTLYRDVYSHPSIEGARLSAPLIRAALTH